MQKPRKYGKHFFKNPETGISPSLFALFAPNPLRAPATPPTDNKIAYIRFLTNHVPVRKRPCSCLFNFYAMANAAGNDHQL
jgi:hypothetical protein